MRTAITIACLIIFCIFNTIKAQPPLPLKKAPLKSRITTLEKADTLTGALYLLKDSSIIVSNSFLKEDYFMGDYELTELYVDDINLISVKGNKTGGILAGAIIGAGLGAVIAAVSVASQPETSSGGFINLDFSGFAYVFLVPAGAAFGAATGAILAGISIKIPINGSMENYKLQKKKLGRYTVKYPGAPTY
jgi:hypothetical protein